MVYRVGVPTMPVRGTKKSYITVANVKWLEQGGMEVVPIPVNTPLREVRALCKGLSGIFLQGGPHFDRQYVRLVRTLLEVSVINRLPVWGTCHGFQMLILLIGGRRQLESMAGMIQRRAVLKEFDTKDSVLYNTATKAEKARLHKMGGVPFSHELGITLKEFLRSKMLCHVFRPLTTTKDAYGTEYVSSIEGRVIPFWGVQFHPELDKHLDWMATFFKDQMKPSEPIEHHSDLPTKAKACPLAWQEGLVMCYEFT